MKFKNLVKAITIINLMIYCISLSLIFNKIFFSKISLTIKDGHYEECVFITNTGFCYHSENCSYITEKTQIGLNQAREKGYRECSHCKGFSNEYIWINSEIDLLEINKYPESFAMSFCVCLIIYCFLNKKYIK